MNGVLDKAREYARTKQYTEAARLFADYLAEQEADDPQIMLELGFALLLAGDQQGAVIVYEALAARISTMSIIPESVQRLWDKYSGLVAGARRKLVLTGVSAALLATSAVAADGKFSAHRYSGGVYRPQLRIEDFKFDKPQAATPTPRPTRPFSAHRYSGGVLLPTHLDQLDQIRGDGPTTTSTAPAATTTKPAATKPAKPSKPGKPTKPPTPATVPSIEDMIDANRPSYSAHKYSGGVFMDRFNEDVLKMKSAQPDGEAASGRIARELQRIRSRKLQRIEDEADKDKKSKAKPKK